MYYKDSGHLFLSLKLVFGAFALISNLHPFCFDKYFIYLSLNKSVVSAGYE